MKSIILSFAFGSIAVFGSYSASYGHFEGEYSKMSQPAAESVEPGLLIRAYAPQLPEDGEESVAERVLLQALDTIEADAELVVASQEIDPTFTSTVGPQPETDLPVETGSTGQESKTTLSPVAGLIAVPTKRPHYVTSVLPSKQGKRVFQRTKTKKAAAKTLKRPVTSVTGKSRKLTLAQASTAKTKRKKITKKVWFTGAFR